MVSSGLYFVLPELVYHHFEEVIGADIPLIKTKSADNLTVMTYQLGEKVPHGQIRKLKHIRTIRFSLEEFSSRFVAGASLPKGTELDAAVKRGIL
jgi:hypothetical protein